MYADLESFPIHIISCLFHMSIHSLASTRDAVVYLLEFISATKAVSIFDKLEQAALVKSNPTSSAADPSQEFVLFSLTLVFAAVI
jgi:hypothetical protein